VLEQTQGLHLHAKFHLNVFTVSASGGQKAQFGANFDFLGIPVPTPFTDEGQIIAHPRYTPTCQCSSRWVYSVALWRRKKQFLPFFGLQYLLMSTVSGNLRKLNMCAQLQTFSYPTASKSFLYSNAFMSKVSSSMPLHAGRKRSKSPLSNLNNRRFALRAMLPVKY